MFLDDLLPPRQSVTPAHDEELSHYAAVLKSSQLFSASHNSQLFLSPDTSYGSPSLCASGSQGVVNYLTSEGLSVDSMRRENCAKEQKRVPETQGRPEEKQGRKH
jgi:hypothetical protein